MPELASRGATPAWRASWASLRKWSIGLISQSSLAAVRLAQPGKPEQLWCDRARPCLQLVVELEDRSGEAAAPAEQFACDPHLGRLLATGERAAEPLQPDCAVERTERDLEGRVELVQVPAQPLLAATSFVDEVGAMGDQQLQLP